MEDKKSKKRTFSTTVDEDLAKRFKTHCAASGKKMSEEISNFMESFIRGNPIEPIYFDQDLKKNNKSKNVKIDQKHTDEEGNLLVEFGSGKEK